MKVQCDGKTPGTSSRINQQYKTKSKTENLNCCKQ